MLMETFDRLTRKEKYVWDVSDDIGYLGTLLELMRELIDLRPCEVPPHMSWYMPLITYL